MKNLLITLLLLIVLSAHSSTQHQSEISYIVAANSRTVDLDLSRFTFTQKTRITLNQAWRLNLEGRAQWADDQTGLGSISAFAQLSRPLIKTDHSRVEIDRAYVTFRHQTFTLKLGKQVTPWGVLDGIQITDRFDPIRRNDFILSDPRPSRISRWGLNSQANILNGNLEISLALDDTANQQANLVNAFSPTSSRFLGGLELTDAAQFTINTPKREHSLQRSTAGVRFSGQTNNASYSLLTFHGPDTEPLLTLGDQGSVIVLTYPNRSLLGLTYDTNFAGMVLRSEFAYVPKQPINTQTDRPLSYAYLPRLLVGIGLDWRMSGDWFFNLQLAVDHFKAKEKTLFRNQTDTLMTFKSQRSLYNDQVSVSLELIGSLSDNDGVLRPAISYDINDSISIETGLDWIFGDTQGIFGQFSQQSRVWLKLTYRL